MAGVDPTEVTGVLQQALSELQRVKKQLNQPFATKTTVAASIARLEDDLRHKAHAIISAAGSEPAAPTSPTQLPPLGVSFRPKPSPLVAGTSPARAEQLTQQRERLLANPTTGQARQYLEERFGVPAPSRGTLSAERSLHPGSGPGQLARGRTGLAAPGVILPRHIREDPHGLPPPEVTDLELDKGLLHLVNRGLLPGKVDLTPALCGEAGPYRAGAVSLHPHQQQFTPGPVTSALEDALTRRQDFKLDLVTPVVRPQQENKQPVLHVNTVGGSGVLALPRPGGAPGSSAYPPGTGPESDYTQTGALLLAHEQGPAGAANATDASDAGAAARGFEALMDTFSLHEIMIRKGQVLRDTPEFESYQRTFAGVWGVLEGLLGHLGALCAQYAVPLAIVNGKSLAELAVQVATQGYAPSMEDLLVCLTNIQEVAGLLKQPGRRFLGPTGADAAAVLIQAHYRGHLARRRDSVRGQASLRIQHAWRTSRLRQQLRERMRMARLERDMRFAELRDTLAEQWPAMRVNAHVVVHVPNLLPQPTTAGDVTTRPEPHMLQAMLLREAAQLARLCDLSEPLLDLLLVLPAPPDPDVVSYWNKLLEVGGVSDPTNRYRIVVPENHARLPGHMSVTAKLLASPRALKRISAAVQGRLSYIVPGNVGDEEVELAVHLGVPLLGPSPSVFRALSKKSAARELFKSIAANIAPGCAIRPRGVGGAQGTLSTAPSTANGGGRGKANGSAEGEALTSPLRAGTQYELGPDGELRVVEPNGANGGGGAVGGQPGARRGTGTGSGAAIAQQQQQVDVQEQQRALFEADEQRVMMTLAEAMVRYPGVAKWLLKIDDEVMGFGHAFFDTASVKGAAEVLQRVADEAAGTRETSIADALRIELGLGPGSGGGGGGGGGGAGVPDGFAGSEYQPLTETQRVSMFRLYELLYRQLPRRLHLACRDSYPTYREYVSAIARRGGVLEACPHMAVGSPCANLFLDPSGNVTVLSTHEKIFCYPYRAVGTTFPQSSVPHRALYDAAMAVGRASYDAGLVGHVMVDFVTLAEADGALRLWLVDLRPGITPSLNAFQLFDFLAAGSFNPMTGAYLVEADTPDDDSTLAPTPEASSQPSALSPHSPTAAHQHTAASALQSLRYYFVLDQLTHPTVRSTPCSKFFYHCWQSGFHFDVDNRQGVIFNLSDRYLVSGALGVICVGLAPSATYSTMQKVLQFVFGMDSDPAARADWAGSPESAAFTEVTSLVKFVAEQSQQQEAAARGAANA